MSEIKITGMSKIQDVDTKGLLSSARKMSETAGVIYRNLVERLKESGIERESVISHLSESVFGDVWPRFKDGKKEGQHMGLSTAIKNAETAEEVEATADTNAFIVWLSRNYQKGTFDLKVKGQRKPKTPTVPKEDAGEGEEAPQGVEKSKASLTEVLDSLFVLIENSDLDDEKAEVALDLFAELRQVLGK